MNKFEPRIIEGIKVDSEVVRTKFACDYTICHGACCWSSAAGSTGCLVTLDEDNFIRKHRLFIASNVKDTKSRRIAYGNPIYFVSSFRCIKLVDNTRCIYSDPDGCILKQLYGRTPHSCGIYPLDEESKNYLTVGHFYDNLCKGGYKKGKDENIYLIDFLREQIIKRFGETFYNKLKEWQNELSNITNITEADNKS